jgi:autophagy-related protein 5
MAQSLPSSPLPPTTRPTGSRYTDSGDEGLRPSQSQSQPPGIGARRDAVQSIPQTLWRLTVPLYINHASQPDAAPFITSIPRFGYLSLLLPRLTAFFGSSCSSFHHEDVQLRNLAVGLLVDLYQPALPWRLVIGDGPEWDIGDTFLNGVKEVRTYVSTSSMPHSAIDCTLRHS